MNNKAIHLLARWLEEQKSGHFEDDPNIDVLEELDIVFSIESKNPNKGHRMRRRHAYFLVIKKIIELQDQIKGI